MDALIADMEPETLMPDAGADDGAVDVDRF